MMMRRIHNFCPLLYGAEKHGAACPRGGAGRAVFALAVFSYYIDNSTDVRTLQPPDPRVLRFALCAFTALRSSLGASRYPALRHMV